MVKTVMQTVFLSPHFDDVALSCGGLVWQMTQAGEKVGLWTICAGDVPAGPLSKFAKKLHRRWKTGRMAVKQRRIEDIASCEILKAEHRHFDLPDCVYRFSETKVTIDGEAVVQRNHLYSEETFLGSIHPEDEPLIEQLAKTLDHEIPKAAQLVSPLAIGGHVDHRLVRQAAERTKRDLLYYIDFPYYLKWSAELERLEQAGWKKRLTPLSREGLTAWQQSIAAHASQISTFWSSLEEMFEAIEAYAEEVGGCVLWEAP